ncbi:hypothetical protein MPER_12476 [Moniliophthora perniciosa FA553]|nr:hypothetical protein MPER_12476 [Moniliophthora perniciosa FA553]
MLEDMQLGDPMGETASFGTFKREEMIELFKGMSVSVVDMKEASDDEHHEEVETRVKGLRVAPNRLDLMFPGNSLDGSRKVGLNPETLSNEGHQGHSEDTVRAWTEW